MLPSMIGEPGTARAVRNVSARGAGRQILHPDGADFVHLVGMAPDVDEALLSHVSGRKRKLNAREHLAVGRNIARGVAGAAGGGVQVTLARLRGDRAKFVYIADQRRIAENLPQRVLVRRPGSARERFAVHHRRDGGIERAFDAEFRGQGANSGIVLHVLSHQNVGDDDLQPLRLEKANRIDESA